MTKQIRVYEDTWRLLDEIVKRTRTTPKGKPTHADIVEQWASAVHPDFYEAIKRSLEALDQVFPDTIEGYRQED